MSRWHRTLQGKNQTTAKRTETKVTTKDDHANVRRAFGDRLKVWSAPRRRRDDDDGGGARDTLTAHVREREEEKRVNELRGKGVR